jgi:hypothetical protein
MACKTKRMGMASHREVTNKPPYKILVGELQEKGTCETSV